MRGSTFLLLLVVTGLAACGGGSGGTDAAGDDGSTQPDATPAPVFRNPVELPDDELALEALKILGANVPGATTTRCNGCHALTRAAPPLLARRCPTPSMPTASPTSPCRRPRRRSRWSIACAHDPRNPSSNFTTTKLGIYATAARLPWFQYVFSTRVRRQRAPSYDAVRAAVGMPHGGVADAPLTQAQFDIVAEWFVARPAAASTRRCREDPPPTTCYAEHLVDGRRARRRDGDARAGARVNRDEHDRRCSAAARATDRSSACATIPLASSTSRTAPAGTSPAAASGACSSRRHATQLVVLDAQLARRPLRRPRRANVAGLSSTIIDLQRDATHRDRRARTTPGSSPTTPASCSRAAPRNMCAQQVLTSNPTRRSSMTEPGVHDARLRSASTSTSARRARRRLLRDRQPVRLRRRRPRR